MVRRVVFLLVVIIMTGCTITSPHKPQSVIRELQPGQTVRLQKGDTQTTVSFDQEGSVSRPIRLIEGSAVKVDLCSTTQTCQGTLPSGVAVRVEQGKVFLSNDSGWKIVDTFDRNGLQLIGWDSDIVVLHSPDRDIFVRQLHTIGGPDSASILYEWSNDLQTWSKAKSGDKPFADKRLNPISKYIVAPAEWRYEYR